MKIISAQSPKYTKDGCIDMTVDFEDIGPVSFTASPDDIEAHSVFLYNRAIAGEFGLIEAYVEPTIPLETLKAQKKLQIEQDRDAACIQNVTALGYTWQADERSQKLLTSALTLAQAGAPLPQAWMSAENVPVPVTDIAQLVEIAGAMSAQTEAAYQASWQRKLALLATTTEEEVKGV